MTKHRLLEVFWISSTWWLEMFISLRSLMYATWFIFFIDIGDLDLIPAVKLPCVETALVIAFVTSSAIMICGLVTFNRRLRIFGSCISAVLYGFVTTLFILSNWRDDGVVTNACTMLACILTYTMLMLRSTQDGS